MSLLILFTGVASPPPVILPAATPWEVYLCDRFGFPISNISRICFGKQLTQTLNQPAQFSWWAPSNDSRIAGAHSDGNPYLMEGRAIRVYRYGVLVFAGHLWQVEDTGDGEAVRTAATCFDPLQWLSRRVARYMQFETTITPAFGTPSVLIASGDTAFDQTYTFVLTQANANPAGFISTEIARGLLNSTNMYDGFTGLDDYYLSAAFRPDNATPASCTNQQAPTTVNALPTFANSRASDTLATLAAQAASFDMEIVPTDSDYYSSPAPAGAGAGASYHQAYLYGLASDYTGILGALLTKPWKTLALLKMWAPTRGAAKPLVVFGYGTYPHNVAGISYLSDLQDLTNNSVMIGGHTTERATNTTSVQTYGAGMDVQSLSDITDPVLLAALATEEATLGGNAKRTLSITPMGGTRTPLPFDDFNIGDTISVNAGADLRGGFTGTQRVYGWTLDIADDHTDEKLANLVTA